MAIKIEQPATDKRVEWIAPEWRTLDLSETAFNPGQRRDGSSQVDCTLS